MRNDGEISKRLRGRLAQQRKRHGADYDQCSVGQVVPVEARSVAHVRGDQVTQELGMFAGLPTRR